MFTVQSNSLTEVPIIAELVEEQPIDLFIIDDDARNTSVTPSGSEPFVIFDIDTAGPAPANQNSWATPANPPTNRNRSATGSYPPPGGRFATVSPKSTPRQLGPILIASGAVVAAVILGLGIFWFFTRSGENPTLHLATKFNQSLSSAKAVLAEQKNKPDKASIDAEVDKMRSVLLACVRSPNYNDSQLKELRTQLSQNADLMRDVKRNCTLLPLAATRDTDVDQLPQMIDLIERQLNYGLRQIVDNRERSNRFLMEAFEHFRMIDQRLADNLANQQAPDLESLGKTLDQLDEACIVYGESALDRVEMTFEQKQIFECGESFRRWCLNQLSRFGFERQCAAVGKELVASKARLDQALRATRLDKLPQTGFDRIAKRMSEPNGLLFPTAEKPVTPSAKNNPGELPGAGEVNRSATAVDSLTSSMKNDPNSSAVNPPNRSLVENSIPDAIKPLTNLPGTERETASVDSSDPDPALAFPESTPRFGRPNLQIKMITRKSKDELDSIATRIADKLKIRPEKPEVMMKGNLVTIVFPSFDDRKPTCLLEHIDFGRVEICDSQSRTVYVNDYD